MTCVRLPAYPRAVIEVDGKARSSLNFLNFASQKPLFARLSVSARGRLDRGWTAASASLKAALAATLCAACANAAPGQPAQR